MTSGNPSGPEACVLEFNPEGHHLAYVEILIRFIHGKTGKKPLFVTSEKAPESKNFEIHLKPIQDRFDLEAVRGIRAGKGRRMWEQFFAILSVLRKMEEKGIRRLYAPTGDELAAILGMARLLGFRTKRLEIRCGLLLLPLAYPTSSWLRRLKRRFFLWLQRRSGAVLLCFDAPAVEILRDQYHISLPTVPDPMLSLGSSLPAPPPSAEPAETLCLGSVGVFDRRKGVDLLLEAFRRARFKRPVQLFLAGKVRDPDLSSQLKNEGIQQGGIQVVDKVLTTEEYAAALRKIDILCLTYRSHVGSSGVYAQAASMGKVIVASDYGWLGWEGNRYNKIAFFKDQSVDSLTQCLEETVSKFEALHHLAGNYHPVSEEDFAKVFCAP